MIFNQPEYQALIHDYDTIAKLKSHEGDKLAVKAGVLELSKGGFLQAPTRTIKNMLYGGYNREAMTTYLEVLSEKTKKFVDELLKNPETLKQSPVEVKQYAKKIKAVASAISSLEYNYRDEGLFGNSGKNETCRKLSKLFDDFHDINKRLKNELKEIDIPIVDMPRQPIDYNAPIDLNKIKLRMPKGQTPEDVLRLAESAEKQVVPTWKKVAASAFVGFTSTVLLIPLQLLTMTKWVIWNPIELIAKGKVTSASPFTWWITNITQWWSKQTSKAPNHALVRYATQLLRAPIITEKHVEAFSKLSSHVKEIDLILSEIGSDNLDELMSLIRKDRDIDEIQEEYYGLNLGKEAEGALKQLLKLDGRLVNPHDFFHFLIKHKMQLKWINDPNFELDNYSKEAKANFNNWKMQFEGDLGNVKERADYFINTLSLDECFKRSKYVGYISPKNLCKLIDIAGKNPKCKKIEIPQRECENIPEIADLLKNHGFKKDPELSWKYTRK